MRMNWKGSIKLWDGHHKHSTLVVITMIMPLIYVETVTRPLNACLLNSLAVGVSNALRMQMDKLSHEVERGWPQSFR